VLCRLKNRIRELKNQSWLDSFFRILFESYFLSVRRKPSEKILNCVFCKNNTLLKFCQEVEFPLPAISLARRRDLVNVLKCKDFLHFFYRLDAKNRPLTGLLFIFKLFQGIRDSRRLAIEGQSARCVPVPSFQLC